MTNRFSHRRQFWFFLTLVTAFKLFLVCHQALAQQPSQPSNKAAVESADKENDEEERRRMFRSFKSRRQSAASNRTRIPPKNPPAVKPTAADSVSSEDAFVGFTVWEMRESGSGTERRSFKLKKPGGESVVLRPFRLGSDSQLVTGRSYVFSIESARTGYLYIIDREQYADGKLGEPLLLFPTKSVHGGSNRIESGDPVEIPDQKSESAYFEATRSDQNHIGEVLTIIVSPKPLIEPARLMDDPITLPVDEVKKWEQQWATKTRWAENVEAVGLPYTEEEGHAGADPSYKLRESDPLPQRLYQVGSKGGDPLVVSLLLRYRESANPE
ncbi:MAG TPA: hypothetical protein VE135_11645 [Pyrinomonadaceae bacterium]|nr:hypothetical protein [Pyrinomonadaceae bacterium]